MTTYRTRLSSAQWHRPLIWLAAAMVVSTVGCLIGLIVDGRMMTGQPIWIKPLKFSLSILIYAVTWAWLIPQLRKFQRLAWWSGTIAAVFLMVEMVAIVGQVFRDTTSHFNVSTPFDTAVWSLMGISIVVVWVVTLIVSALLFRNPGPDPARNLAIRVGALIAVLGMGLAFLMTAPTAAQLANGVPEIIGAHTVGLTDGGPEIPFLGWSSVAGDLRIPHFVGMHALQVIPLVVIVLEWISRRGSGRLATALRDNHVRAELVWIAGGGYLALIASVTWQALRGQSLIHPDALTLVVWGAIVLGVVAGALRTVTRQRSESSQEPPVTPHPQEFVSK